MSRDDVPPNPSDAEKSLLLKQSLRYAQDLVRVYEEEKEKRNELELANDRLRLEVEDRKRAEERFRAIFETAQDCIYIKDRSLRYTHVNPAMERLFQLPASEIIGKKDQNLYGQPPSRHLEAVDMRVLRGESVEEEYNPARDRSAYHLPRNQDSPAQYQWRDRRNLRNRAQHHRPGNETRAAHRHVRIPVKGYERGVGPGQARGTPEHYRAPPGGKRLRKRLHGALHS